MGETQLPFYYNFNPRSPHGERLHVLDIHFLQKLYFNPRSPHGERLPWLLYGKVGQGKFQSTLPARGATRTEFFPT